MSHPPFFYDPDSVGTLFYPDISAISTSADAAGLSPADEDHPRVLLLLIDMQIDFCHENGTLFVPGAPADLRRVIEFVYANAGRITHITATLDSHVPFQIFHPAWWVDPDGQHPEPYTVVSREQVEDGTWRATRNPEWSLRYVRQLEKETKKQLTIWPYHVPIGGIGNALDPALWSAIFWHSIARKNQPTFWRKGSIPGTEHYSILKPEIEVADEPRDSLGTELLDSFEAYDSILVAGEAASHCVLESVEDLVEAYRRRPDQLQKITVLQDCMSPVVHPEIDFEAITRKRFREFGEMGVSFRKASEALPLQSSS